MEEKRRSDLVRNLGAVYNDAWEDEAVRDQLVAEPRTVLAEHGIQLPATVKVEAEVVEAAPDARLVMVESGTIKLKVPASRPAGLTTELSDEELEGVSGGMVPPGFPVNSDELKLLTEYLKDLK